MSKDPKPSIQNQVLAYIKIGPIKSSRRHPEEERVGRAADSFLLMKHKELDHATLQFESLPCNTKGKILIHVSKP